MIHAHDWQTGLVPVYQKMVLLEGPVVGGVPVVFTIHNLAFQGLFPASTVESIGLGWDVLDVQAMEYWGQISYLKAGINFSERITTVSPTYACEITTPSSALDSTASCAGAPTTSSGILNGIDITRWNPAADEYVPAHFLAERPGRQGRREACAARAARGSAGSDAARSARPLIGLVSRLTDQKGFDLVAASVDELMSLDASWVMLGSGERRYEELWQGARGAASRPRLGDDRVRRTARSLIEAGADMFLMPSRFEPCGLNQLYSLRYGTVPIVRATGGLKDTVEDAGRQRQGHRVHVHPVHARGAGGRRPSRARHLQEPGPLAGDAATGHAAGPFLGRFGPRVCQSVQSLDGSSAAVPPLEPSVTAAPTNK